MRKIITTAICLVAGASLLQAQGLVKFYATSTAFSIYTNTGLSSFSGGSETAGTSGKVASSNTANGANGFYYQLLTANMNTFTAGTHSSTNPVASGWTAPAGLGLGTNYIGAGSLGGPGGNNGTAVAGWANGGAAAQSDTEGVEKQFLIVGWSANLGTTWTDIQNQLTAGVWNAAGFFGVSQMGFGYSGGGGTPATGAVSLFGVSASMPGGLSSGFNLFGVVPTVVPEPGTMALAALGGASLLLFRRRKS